MRRLLIIAWAAQASLIPKDPDEGVTVVVARDESDCLICAKPNHWWTFTECPLLWTPNENTVGRWKIVQDANNTVGCHPKQKRAKDDTWPVCNMCYEERCCALDAEKCCVFDRRLVLNVSFLVFLVLGELLLGLLEGREGGRAEGAVVGGRVAQRGVVGPLCLCVTPSFLMMAYVRLTATCRLPDRLRVHDF